MRLTAFLLYEIILSFHHILYFTSQKVTILLKISFHMSSDVVLFIIIDIS